MFGTWERGRKGGGWGSVETEEKQREKDRLKSGKPKKVKKDLGFFLCAFGYGEEEGGEGREDRREKERMSVLKKLVLLMWWWLMHLPPFVCLFVCFCVKLYWVLSESPFLWKGGGAAGAGGVERERKERKSKQTKTKAKGQVFVERECVCVLNMRGGTYASICVLLVVVSHDSFIAPLILWKYHIP